MKLVQVEKPTTPGLDQTVKDNVHADLVPESEAIGHRASNAVDANGLALDTMLLDAEIEQERRDVHYSNRSGGEMRHTRAPGNGNPDVGRKLRADS